MTVPRLSTPPRKQSRNTYEYYMPFCFGRIRIFWGIPVAYILVSVDNKFQLVPGTCVEEAVLLERLKRQCRLCSTDKIIVRVFLSHVDVGTHTTPRMGMGESR
jgi:hypothetical protein